MNQNNEWKVSNNQANRNGNPRREIKLDYQSISAKYVDMQETNGRLQRLISKFSTDPDRKLRSVFESVQHQNSIAREGRKTSANVKPISKVTRANGSHLTGNTAYNPEPRKNYPIKINRPQVEKLPYTDNQPKPRETPVFPNGVFENEEARLPKKDYFLVRERPHTIKDNNEEQYRYPHFDQNSDSIPRQIPQNLPFRLQK